jgi:N-methylhydantoinase A
VAAGGAGPIHASAIARELEIPLMLVPRDASVMCAVGQLMSDLRHDFVRSYVSSIDKLDPDRVLVLYKEMQKKAVDTLRSEGIPRDKIVIALAADLRYIGQFNEVEVTADNDEWTPAVIERLVQNFHQRHEALNGYRMPSAPLEIVNLRVVGTGIVDKPELAQPSTSDQRARAAPMGCRKAYFDDGFTDVFVYDGV